MAKDVVVKVVANTSQFDNNMKKATSTLTQFGKGGVANITSMLGPWGKLAAAIGGAKVAQEAFMKTINATQATQDAFNRAMDQSKAATDLLFASIARGDLSSFVTGLGDALKNAGELYDKLDALGSMQLRSNFAISMLDSEKEIYLLKMKDKTLSDEERENAKKMYEYTVKRISALRKGSGFAEIETGELGLTDLVKNNTSALNKYGFNYYTNAILQGLAKNTEVFAQDIMEYSENTAATVSEAKSIIEQYEKEKQIAGKKIEKFKSKSHRETEYWMNISEGLDTKLKNQLKAMPQYLIALILEQVDDSAESELKKYMDMIAQGNAKNAANQRDIYAGNRAAASIGASTASASSSITAVKGTSNSTLYGSVDDANRRMAYWKKQYNAAADQAGRDYAQAYIDSINRELEIIKYGGASNAILAGVKIEMPKLDNTGLEDMNKKTVDLKGNLQGVAHIMATLGNTMTQTGSDGAAAFMNILSSVIPLIGAVMALNVAQAEGKAVSSSKNWIELIAATAAVVATVVGTFQANKDAGKFAEGGIVGGSSYYGDKLIAHVNSGEGILTRQGVRNLDSIMSGRGESTIRVDIKNDKLTGTLRNAYARSKYTN